MPFVQRRVEPRNLSRNRLFDDDGRAKVDDEELQAVTNNTLCNALRQLASLLLVANDIFEDLGGQLGGIRARADAVKVKIDGLEGRVVKFDPKEVTVPESDICTFAALKHHYAAAHPASPGAALFLPSTRPAALAALYEAAAATPVHLMRQLDRWRRDGRRTSGFFLCTPVLGARRRRRGIGGGGKVDVDIDIETGVPAAVEDLRRWTSNEALGDITVTPDCTNRINSAVGDGDVTDGTVVSDDEGLDHKLPSPEEQVQVVALKFPAEIVAVDVSGRNFDRMSIQRRSLVHGDLANRTTDGDANAARRRTRTRKPRNRRRNTLAGTDQKEIQDALTAGDEPSSPTFNRAAESSTSGAVCRSKSSDLLRSSSKKECPDNKKSHFNTLKQWGKNRYDRLMNKSAEKNDSRAKDDIDDFNVYETVTMKRKRDLDMERRTHERNASISSSEKSSINAPLTNTLSSVMNIAVRLRESSAQRRLRRSGGNKDEPHSSSGNWSASSESGRASIGSEITTTTQPKSSTSAATSNNSLNVPSSVNSRRRFVNNSASSSVTSEGTLTPDIIHDLHEDGETSSVYSCDTEGYYTSFHMDSGLKTLKEEDTPPTPLHSTSAFSNSVLSAENEYELFGKGSTSTTTSSAGTVCTTLRASESNKSLIIGPAIPERKSSLSKLSNKSPESSLERDFGDKTGTVKRSPATKPVVVAMVHKQNDSSKRNSGDISPDSGHNTSSSPIESMSSPNGVRSGSDFEFSESSDMEGPERIERIRVKTTINSSRIPSMCVITPSQSDDESSNSSNSSRNNYQKQLQEKNNFNQIAEGSDRIHHIINTMVNGASKLSLVSVNPQSGYATVQRIEETEKPSNTNVLTSSSNAIRAPSPSGGTVTIKDVPESKSPTSPIIKASLLPLNNMFGRLKNNLASFAHKRDRSKSPNLKGNNFDAGEYVTIADIRNNNEKNPVTTEDSSSVNDVVNRNLITVLSGRIRDAEYISLDELPCNENNNLAHTYTNLETIEKTKRQGAKVTVDAEGKVIYNSDSLKRRRNCHTTFQPGKNVKAIDASCESPLPVHRTPKSVRPVNNSGSTQISVEFHTPPSHKRPIPQQTPRDAGPISPTHKKERVQSPANLHLIPNTALGSVEHQSPSPQEMYGEQVLDMDVNRYLPNQYYLQKGGPLYSTLPLKKTQYLSTEVRPERSVTPDITRGLGRNNGNSLDRRETIEESPRTFYTFSKNAPVQKLGIPIQMPDINRLNLQNTSFTPTKVDFRDYVPSQARPYDEADSFKISPIDPRHSGGFQSSTPSGKSSDLKAATNLDRILLSPKKSTMSNEELYAVIHKSKKKMHIETEETPRSSPVTVQNEPPRQTVQSPETGYIGDKSKSRLSWSPNKGDYVDFSSDIDKLSPPNESRSRQSWACNDRKPKTKQTSTIDFKRLLLQKSSISSPKKISAVEQLKLSREQIKPKPQPEMNILNLSASPRSLVNRRFLNNPPGSPNREPKPVAKIMSPRSQWRFANPRSDVLSSTILEDCREDESPNSSGERKASPRAGNKIVVTEGSPTSPKGMPRYDSGNTPYTSATQRLYAQRAQFFNPVTDKNSQPGRQQAEKKSEPPTLETAF